MAEKYKKGIAAGLLMYRIKNNALEVFISHPGGPFFAKKDEGVWSLPKGLTEEGENLFETAKREFEEETGIRPEPKNGFVELGSIEYSKGGKTVHAWAFETDVEQHGHKSNLFEMEWPPKSGKMQKFPESDKSEFFPAEIAKIKIQKDQAQFISRLEEKLKIFF
jgi:predicted NUDIX family NTP pyrophosphohydrolase